MAHARAGTLPILVALALAVALAIAQPATASEPRWAEAIGDRKRERSYRAVSGLRIVHWLGGSCATASQNF